ncbi:MAG: ABC transporter permease [Ignisphaera sp.]
MHPVVKYIIKRFGRMLLTIWIGLTITFIVSRSLPFNPADVLVSRLTSYALQLRPEELERMRRVIYDLFGLRDPIYVQYIKFLYGYFLGEMGPSFTYFPVKVSEIISASLPWSIFLLMQTSIISWLIGNFLGVVAALSKHRRFTKGVEYFAMGLQPIPFAIFAIAYLIFYVVILKGSIPAGEVMRGKPIIEVMLIAFRRSIIPLTAMVIWGWMGNFLGMKSLAMKLKNEDFVEYAKLRGAPQRTITWYVTRNAITPQFTYLLLSLGMIFTGAALVEYLFSYPGIGILLVTSVLNADYNLMLGIVYMSIVGVAIAAFILDIVYPIIDPRIRYPGQ